MHYLQGRAPLVLSAMLATASDAYTQGVVTTVAGASWSFRADGQPATEAPLGHLQGLTIGSDGSVLTIDTDNCLVVKIVSSGTLRIVGGNGLCGHSGDEGPATSASISRDYYGNGLSAGNGYGMAVDFSGNLYFADTRQSFVRKITPAGVITTVAGVGGSPIFGSNAPLGDGGPATAASVSVPSAVAVDRAGTLYIADTGNSRIRRVDASGQITTIAGNSPLATLGLSIGGYSGDGGPAGKAALDTPLGIAVDQGGNIYVADSRNSRIRKITPNGVITTIAGNGTSGRDGDGGPAKNATLVYPTALALDDQGNLYFADGLYWVRRISRDGIITTVAGNGCMTPIGGCFSGDGGAATAASLDAVGGLSVDSAGVIYIADTFNYRVRKITRDGVIQTIAGNHGYRFAGDGGPATLSSLNTPASIRFDPAGGLYVADIGNNRVRRILPSGVIETVAGNGTALFAGDGSTATSTGLVLGEGSLAVDSTGNLFVPDSGSSRVRKVDSEGRIATVAGNGDFGSG